MSLQPGKKIKLLFTCLDWRLHPAVENFFISGNLACDECTVAGSIKGLLEPATQGFFIEQINISKKLHDCCGVILTAHMDCGAYGGSSVFGAAQEEAAFHKEQLKQAQAAVSRAFPGLPVESYIIGLERASGGWKITPQKIKP